MGIQGTIKRNIQPVRNQAVRKPAFQPRSGPAFQPRSGGQMGGRMGNGARGGPRPGGRFQAPPMRPMPRAPMGGKGGKNGGKGGGWVWMPAGAAPVMAFGGKGGRSFGRVATVPQVAKKTQTDKLREKLSKVDAAKKVWVGNMSKKTTWKELKQHFIDNFTEAKPTMVDVNEKRGTGVVCYKEEADASTAITLLGGTELGGQAIEVDVWTQKEKPEGAKKDKKPMRAKAKRGPMVLNMQKKLKGKQGKEKSKFHEKLKDIDHDKKAWIGGLDPKTTFKDLQKHFEENGVAKPHIVDVRGKGQACVAFKEVGDVDTAISILSGTELKGKTLEVDVWTKPERPEKKEKKVKEEKDA